MSSPTSSTSSLAASSGLPDADAAPTALADLSVIIVNYNVRDFLAQALRSVERASKGLIVETIVVDNASVDGSSEMVRQEFPGATLVENDRNVGFGRANNQAIRRAKGRYLLILNPDTILQEDTLRVLVSYLDSHPDAGAAGCQILNPDGTFAPESRRAYPTPTVAFYRIIGLSKLFPHSPIFGRYNMTFLPKDAEAEVDALSGSCMMVRHAALLATRTSYAALPPEQKKALSHGQVAALNGTVVDDGAGLFDEDFFMYAEDLDWCYRIQQAGWSIRYTPQTRIIHYKGESTKKGDLRYVRLFYGAMLHFIEKHFRNRHSRMFAILIRVGIMGRALMSVLNGASRRFRPAFLEFALVFLSVAGVGLLRSWMAGNPLSNSFLMTVVPAYALSVVAGIAAAGGYRPSRRHSLRPVVVGAVSGLLVVSAASFFLKDIAFSRMVVGLSFAIIVPILALRRLLGRESANDARRALLVGTPSEAERLYRMLRRHPAPPFELEGYVDPAGRDASGKKRRVARLGSMTQLRDLVRLRRIDDVIFASEGSSHAASFDVMQELRDLPVQFRMLVEGREHLIAKASVEDLTLPAIVEVEDAAVKRRTYVARRTFELSVAIPALVAFPLLYIVSRVTTRGSLLRRIVERMGLAPAVVTGRLALVGYTRPRESEAAASVGVSPAVFGVTETLPTSTPNRDVMRRAYCFYARHQSASLDCSIILRSLKNRR